MEKSVSVRSGIFGAIWLRAVLRCSAIPRHIFPFWATIRGICFFFPVCYDGSIEHLFLSLVTIQCKSKSGIGSGVGSTTESESEGSEEFLFLPIPLPLTSLPSCRFTLDQNFLPIPTPLTTPLPSLPSLV